MTTSKYISSAELHLAWKSRGNIPRHLLADLLEQGYTIKRGRFSAREDRRLRRNWERFCRFYPEFNDPIQAFGVRHGPLSKQKCLKVGKIDENDEDEFVVDDDCSNHRNKVELKKLQINLRMAYKLDERLVCDIYARCRKLIAYKQFSHQSKVTLPDELFSDVALEIFDKNKSIPAVSREMDVSPRLVGDIKRRPIRVTRHSWRDEDDLALAESIERQFNNSQDAKSIPSHLIDWKKVSESMKEYGYSLVPSQIYKRWHKINNSMVGLKNTLRS